MYLLVATVTVDIVLHCSWGRHSGSIALHRGPPAPLRLYRVFEFLNPSRYFPPELKVLLEK